MPQTTKTQNRQPRKVPRRISPKAAAILFAIIVVVVVAAIVTIKVQQWRNDGARYAQTLSEQIGVSPETAEKYARMKLEKTSEYACVNMAADEDDYIYESKKSVQVSGVTIPEWLILTSTVNNVVTEVSYYDYRQLKEYGNGVKTKAHISYEGINTGMDSAAVQKYMGFAPFCTRYNGENVVESYKYYYKDKNTGDTVSYLLHVTYNADGKAASAAEEENYFILSVLTLE